MKKSIILFLSFVTFAIFFTSCEKDGDVINNYCNCDTVSYVDTIMYYDTIPYYDTIIIIPSDDGIRYIKFESTYSDDDEQVNVYEIQAFYNNINIALNKPATANSTRGGNEAPQSAIDGNANSRWSSDRVDAGPDINNPHYIVVDLNGTYKINSVVVNIQGWDSWKQTFKVYVSKDNLNWNVIGEGDNVTGIFTYNLQW